MFQLAGHDDRGGASLEGAIVLDMLGGDGTLARAFSRAFPGRDTFVITSDVSAAMIAGAIAYGLPALLQPATSLLLGDETVDVSIIAYGTHHIPRIDLPLVLREASRVLKPGGRVIVHDFLEDSPVSDWFHTVVHPETVTGHNYRHFQPGELGELMKDAGLRKVSERMIYDPLIVTGTTRLAAQGKLSQHLLDMYGLRGLLARFEPHRARETVYALAERIFEYQYADLGLEVDFGQPGVVTVRDGNQYRTELPRVAMVAYGQR